MAENNKNKNKVQIDPTYAHLQPQAVNVEQAVLGALMIDSDAFSVVSELLKPDTFYDPRHKRIYQAIQVMNMEERPVDIMTLADQLAKTGELDKVGGAQYLMDISAGMASAAHVESHARILAQKYMQRQLIHYAGDIETMAYEEGVDVDELMQKAEGELFQLSQNNMKQDYTQIDPVVKEAVAILQRAAQNSGGLSARPSRLGAYAPTRARQEYGFGAVQKGAPHPPGRTAHTGIAGFKKSRSACQKRQGIPCTSNT